MTRTFQRSRVPELTAQQWAVVQPWLVQGKQVDDDAWLPDLTKEQATAVFLGLYEEGSAALHLMVYHQCSDQPVAAREFMEGFQSCPWRCPGCSQKVPLSEAWSDTLQYSLRLTLLRAVELVP